MDALNTAKSKGKESAKKKGAERKGTNRSLTKKRSEMTKEELTCLRKSDKEKKQRSRSNLTEEKKEEIRRKERNRKRENTEQETMNSLLRMRKMRLVQSDEMKEFARQKAKDGMRMHRKEGALRIFKERNKKHLWAVKWKTYLSKNPDISQLEDEKRKKKKNKD